jgi:hypothetical protein
MEAADEAATDGPPFLALQQQSEAYKLAATIWHLTELLFFEASYDLRHSVRSWIQANFLETISAEDWGDVLLLVIQGQARAVEAIICDAVLESCVSFGFVLAAGADGGSCDCNRDETAGHIRCVCGSGNFAAPFSSHVFFGES